MTEKVKTPLAEIFDALQTNRPPDCDESVLVGYVVVSEWVDGDGVRYLTKIAADATGSPMVSWQERGYMNEVLNHWSDDYDDDDLESEE